MVEAPLRVRGVREHGVSRVAGSLWRYGKNALLIILRSMRDVRPLQFFGMMAAGLLAFGLLCGFVVFGWWASTGHTTPLQSVLVGSATFLVLGFVEGTAVAFANDRITVDGNTSIAMKIIRALNRMEVIVLPRFIAKRAVKTYPDIKLMEKLVLASRVYGRLVLDLFGANG